MFTIAIDHGLGMRKLFGMVHPYPAWAELRRTCRGRLRPRHVPGVTEGVGGDGRRTRQAAQALTAATTTGVTTAGRR